MPVISPSNQPPSRRHLWWRALWLVVLLLHTPATLHAILGIWRLDEHGPAASSLLFLAASNVFFIFEICFAGSFRLLTNRRNAVVFLLIVAMLHVGVVERRMTGGEPHSQLVYCLQISALAAGEWRRLLRRVRALVSRLDDSIARNFPHPAPRFDLFQTAAAVSHRPIRIWNCAPLRAPPFVVC